ncbi:MAG TPA: FAD-dependent oxidoreductase, partial [Rhizomicrobium sp.]
MNIVLVGGGHAHVHVLVELASRPLPGMRVTLIARDMMTPYSGMLPGVIAGLYKTDEAHIDLARLAAVTGAHLVHAQANGLDRAGKRVLLVDLPPVAYDLVSFDVGTAPSLTPIDGADAHAIAVKPIGSFLRKLDELIARCRRADGPRRIVTIGGGAGGVELLLSLRTRLLAQARADGRDATEFSFALVSDGEILATHNARVRAVFRRVFAERGMGLREHARARAVTAAAVVLDNGDT